MTSQVCNPAVGISHDFGSYGLVVHHAGFSFRFDSVPWLAARQERRYVEDHVRAMGARYTWLVERRLLDEFV